MSTRPRGSRRRQRVRRNAWIAAAAGLVVVGVTVAVVGFRERAPTREEHVRRAEAALARNDFEAAGAAFGQAAQADPTDVQLLVKQASAYEAAYNFNEATDPARRAADLLPDDLDTQLMAARVLLRRRAFEEVSERMSAQLVRYPRNVDVLLALGNARAQLVDSRRGLLALAEAGDAERFNLEMSLLRPNVDRGSDPAAESAFRTALDVRPGESTRLALANFYLAAARLSDAETLLRDVTLARASELGNHALGALLYVTGRYQEAEPYLKKVVSYPGWARRPNAMFQLSGVYMELGRDDEAVELLKGLLPDHDEQAATSLRLAALELRSGRRADAFGRLDALIARKPVVVEAALLRARTLLHEDDAAQATKFARLAVEAAPESPEARGLLGQALAASGDLENASDELSTAVALRPGNGPHVVALLRVTASLGRVQEAYPMARDAARLNADDTAAVLEAARTMIAFGDYAGAERELSRHNPGTAAHLVVLARLRSAQRRPVEARAAVTRAQALAPTAPDVVSALVDLDLADGRVEAAVRRAQSAAAAHPTDPVFHDLVAKAQAAARHADLELAALRRVLDLDPSNLDALTRLATPDFIARHPDEARSRAERLIARRPRAVAARLLLADLNERRGSTMSAIRHYEAILAERSVVDGAAVAHATARLGVLRASMTP